MKVPYRWLNDYVKIDRELDEVVDALIMTGNAVENVFPPREDALNIRVGRILKIEKHPDADKLLVCQIDTGEDGPVQIVTGADNVFEGALVPVALHNSHLPNGVHIKKGKLRGVESNGMLCSGEELCLKESDYPGAEVYGILILKEEDAYVGEDIREVFMWDDTVLEFEVGANRSDCLSVLGTARETAASLKTAFTLPSTEYLHDDDDICNHYRVDVLDTDLCPRYMARMIKNVKIERSPKWMRQRLTAAGIRPINNIVDITNFVMLEYGQPMHAFDGRRIAGDHIIVRRAEEGETIRTLDGKDHPLSSNNLLICDESGPIGIAGVMGGENSEIEEDTDTVVFEAAKFSYGNIRKTSRELGMATESSMRFSKGLDATICEQAINRACELVCELGAGEVVGGTIDILSEDLSPKKIETTAAYINGRLGTELSAEEMASCLERVFIRTEIRDDTLVCEIPRYRIDMEGKADISEEVARIYGYNNIPETLGNVHFMTDEMPDPDKMKSQIRDYLTLHGYFECVTYSFMGMQDLDRIGIDEDHPLRKAVRIINPLGDDRAFMRTTMLPSMLDTVALNLNRKNDELSLFEIGRTFMPETVPVTDTLPVEHNVLILAKSEKAGDFYSLKNDVENVLFAISGEFPRFASGGAAYWHPGRKAVIYIGGRPVGEMGELHPKIAGNYDIQKRITLALIELDGMEVYERNFKYAPIARFPAVERDIAVIVGEDTEAGSVKDCIEGNGGKYLESCELFDVFRSESLGEGKKSLAFSLKFRSPSETLTDAIVQERMDNIIRKLSEDLGAELRS